MERATYQVVIGRKDGWQDAHREFTDIVDEIGINEEQYTIIEARCVDIVDSGSFWDVLVETTTDNHRLLAGQWDNESDEEINMDEE